MTYFIRQALIADRADRSEGEDLELVREVARGQSIWTAFQRIDRHHHPEAFGAAHAEESVSNGEAGNPAPTTEVVSVQGPCVEAGESILELMYPSRPNSPANENQAAVVLRLKSDVVAFQQEVMTLRRALDIWKWAYEVEHLYGEDMSGWRILLSGHVTTALVQHLSVLRSAMDETLAKRELSAPLPLPGCLSEFHRRSRDARDGKPPHRPAGHLPDDAFPRAGDKHRR